MRERIIYEIITKIKRYQEEEKSIKFYYKELKIESSYCYKLFHKLDSEGLIELKYKGNFIVPRVTQKGVERCQELNILINKNIGF